MAIWVQSILVFLANVFSCSISIKNYLFARLRDPVRCWISFYRLRFIKDAKRLYTIANDDYVTHLATRSKWSPSPLLMTVRQLIHLPDYWPYRCYPHGFHKFSIRLRLKLNFYSVLNRTKCHRMEQHKHSVCAKIISDLCICQFVSPLGGRETCKLLIILDSSI